MTVPAAWLERIKDPEAFILEVDPDYREHFETIDLAMDHYTLLDPKDWLRAEKVTQ